MLHILIFNFDLFNKKESPAKNICRALISWLVYVL